MGVIRTDKWMEKWIDVPEELCKKANPNSDNPTEFFHYLRSFGMYHSPRMAKKLYEELKENKAWEEIDKIYQKYKNLWDGPEVQVYIFPINNLNRGLMRQTNGKSGVTFRDKLFLFLSPIEDLKEWESLFVHEYNHATRMNQFSKKLHDYSLLDSMVFEGLAEHAVEEYCGEEYLAVWTRAYSEKQLEHYWNSEFKERIDIKKNKRLHDDLLFGKKYVPRMMGYSMGYRIISEYKKSNTFNTKLGINIPSKKLLTENFFY